MNRESTNNNLDATGKLIGSAHIDWEFESLITSRVEHLQHILTWSPKQTVTKMVRGEFEPWKCSFGEADFPTFRVKVPGLPASYNDAAANIENSRMVFTK